MIVVVASACDVRALRIVAHWGSRCAAILSAEDLCRPGWNFQVPGNQRATAVVGGRAIPVGEIRGILTLRPCIFPEELQDIQTAHRQYVAAELNAFLLAWLSAQSCPVLNKPTATCLAGPNWRHEQWTLLAARQGISAHSRRHVPTASATPEAGETLEAIAVGEHCFGCSDASLREQTLGLARAAGVDLLSVSYSGDGTRLLSASVWPRLTDPAVLEAVRQRLETAR